LDFLGLPGIDGLFLVWGLETLLGGGLDFLGLPGFEGLFLVWGLETLLEGGSDFLGSVAAPYSGVLREKGSFLGLAIGSLLGVGWISWVLLRHIAGVLREKGSFLGLAIGSLLGVGWISRVSLGLKAYSWVRLYRSTTETDQIL